jgi:hypothetical protein
MTNLTKLAAFAVLALGATTTLASAIPLPGPAPFPFPVPGGPNTPNAPTLERHGAPDLECRMKGLDFWIINFGGANVDSGRQVAWSSPTTEDGAIITLPKTLAPGEQLKLADVLSDVPYRGAPCIAAFA